MWEWAMLLAKEYKLLTNQAHSSCWSSHEDMFNSGLPIRVIDNLCSLLGTDKKHLASIIDWSTKPINQTGNNSIKLNKIATERVLLIVQVFCMAENYFGSKVRAQSWLNTKNLVLGDKTPLELCCTYTGIQLVKNVIIQLEHGMTA
jgi:putative toxin-antitoxin system antitoxin component (TIGR02293 family)